MKKETCNLCDLCLLNNMKLTWGVGNPNADIMFIGSTPTASEVRTGELFVGRPYELFNKLLFLHNFNRNNSYFTNIVKCRTPKHRYPTAIEIRKCMPYLIQELEEVKPRIIVLLGDSTLKYFYNDFRLSIMYQHGKANIINGYVIIPVLPANGIYANTENLNIILADYQKVTLLYKQIYRNHTINY